ncbi:35160_t:CDS:2, partial [Racocetra persica]
QYDVLKNNSTKYNHIIETDSSVGNFSYHLHITHGVTKFGKLILDNSQASIDDMLRQRFKNNVEYKEQVNSMVAEFLISDSQPFFGIKARICMSYNWMLATLQDILKNSMNF